MASRPAAGGRAAPAQGARSASTTAVLSRRWASTGMTPGTFAYLAELVESPEYSPHLKRSSIRIAIQFSVALVRLQSKSGRPSAEKEQKAAVQLLAEESARAPAEYDDTDKWNFVAARLAGKIFLYVPNPQGRKPTRFGVGIIGSILRPSWKKVEPLARKFFDPNDTQSVAILKALAELGIQTGDGLEHYSSLFSASLKRKPINRKR